MKTADRAIFTGVLVCGLIAHGTSLHAQPPPTGPPVSSSPATSAPTTSSSIAVEGSDDKPWNRGVAAATRQSARDLFLEGNRLFNIPLFTRAAEKYTAALDKWKHPAFYFNLALAQLNLGQEVEARNNLERALQYGQEPLGLDQYKEAQKQLHEVERQLGRIRITCSTPGAEVTLDGAMAFTGPGNFEGWVTAKHHEIVAKKPDYLPQARRVAVAPGTLQDLDLRLITLSEAEVTRWAVWKPWAVVASGAAVVIAGGGVHALSRQNFNSYDSRFQRLPCASTGCKEADIGPDLSARLRHASLEQKLAVGGYIAGGSLIAAGSVLLYLNRPRLAEQDRTGPPAMGVTIVPTVSVSMLSVLATINY